MLVRDDDVELQRLLAGAGFVADDDGSGGTTWMDARDRPDVAAAAGGVRARRPRRRDRRRRIRCDAEMAARSRPASGSARSTTLRSILPSRPPTAEVAGYALFWFDPVTEVGLLEPMRVEDEYQRRGLARAMLTAGLDRLAKRGARRLKVGYATDAARALHRRGLPRDRDRHDIPPSQVTDRYSSSVTHSSRRRNTTQALCPPKPNEFETPTVIALSRASFGM